MKGLLWPYHVPPHLYGTSRAHSTLVPEFAARGLGKAITQVVTAIGADRPHDILQNIYITKWEGQKWTRRG